MSNGNGEIISFGQPYPIRIKLMLARDEQPQESERSSIFPSEEATAAIRDAAERARSRLVEADVPLFTLNVDGSGTLPEEEPSTVAGWQVYALTRVSREFGNYDEQLYLLPEAINGHDFAFSFCPDGQQGQFELITSDTLAWRYEWFKIRARLNVLGIAPDPEDNGPIPA